MLAKIKRNVKYILDQIFSSLLNCSHSIKAICFLLFIGHLCSYNNRLFEGLTLTPLLLPKLFYNFYTLLTYAFVEYNILFCLLDILAIFICGKLIEPLWGSLELLKFFALVIISTGFYTSIIYLLLYAATSDVSYLFEIHICGLSAFLAGLSVAIKQIMPDHVLISFKTRNLKLRNSNIPLLLLMIVIGLKFAHIFDYYELSTSTLHPLKLWKPGEKVDLNLSHHIISLKGTQREGVRALSFPTPLMFGIGIITSWIYLRYFQKHSNGSRGDMEDSFSFASFFPKLLQPPIKIVSHFCFELLVKLKLCKKKSILRSRTHESASTPSASIILNIPGMDNFDAERRRLKALKALNERMGGVKEGASENLDFLNQSQWPSLNSTDDDEEDITIPPSHERFNNEERITIIPVSTINDGPPTSTTQTSQCNINN